MEETEILERELKNLLDEKVLLRRIVFVALSRENPTDILAAIVAFLESQDNSSKWGEVKEELERWVNYRFLLEEGETDE